MGSPEVETRHTVLVVDDDWSSLDIIRRTLHGEHHVLVAENGAQALQILDSNPVDLLLLDVMLPETPGFEICRRVKSRTRDSYLPVLLLSALDEQSVAAQAQFRYVCLGGEKETRTDAAEFYQALLLGSRSRPNYRRRR